MYHPLFSGPLIIALPLFVLGKAVSFRSYRRVAEAKFRDAIWQSSKQLEERSPSPYSRTI